MWLGHPCRGVGEAAGRSGQSKKVKTAHLGKLCRPLSGTEGGDTPFNSSELGFPHLSKLNVFGRIGSWPQPETKAAAGGSQCVRWWGDASRPALLQSQARNNRVVSERWARSGVSCPLPHEQCWGTRGAHLLLLLGFWERWSEVFEPRPVLPLLRDHSGLLTAKSSQAQIWAPHKFAMVEFGVSSMGVYAGLGWSSAPWLARDPRALAMNLWVSLLPKSVFEAGKEKVCVMHRAGTRGLRSPSPSTYPPAPDPRQDDDESGQHGEEDGDNGGPGGVEGEACVGARVEGEGAIPQCHPAAQDG